MHMQKRWAVNYSDKGMLEERERERDGRHSFARELNGDVE